MPVQAAAALEVHKVIQKDNLVDNVFKQGKYMEKRLKALLGDHPNVGEIRGMGLLYGIDFVRNKDTRVSFGPERGIGYEISNIALSAPFNISVYPSSDYIIISPPFIVTTKDIDIIAKKVSNVIHKVFNTTPLNIWIITNKFIYLNYILLDDWFVNKNSYPNLNSNPNIEIYHGGYDPESHSFDSDGNYKLDYTFDILDSNKKK